MSFESGKTSFEKLPYRLPLEIVEALSKFEINKEKINILMKLPDNLREPIFLALVKSNNLLQNISENTSTLYKKLFDPKSPKV